MPRDWNDLADDDGDVFPNLDDEDSEEEDDENEDNETRSRSRSRNREGAVVNISRARQICNNPDTIDARICVMNLNKSVDKDLVEGYFSQFGKVVAIFMLRNKNAFVQFEDEEDARDCLDAGKTAQLGDVTATVMPAKKGGSDVRKQPLMNKKKSKVKVDFNDEKTADARVFVDPVNADIQRNDIYQEMTKFGKVLGVQIQSRKDKDMPRYAFVQFADIRSADACLRKRNITINGYNIMLKSVASSSKGSSSTGVSGSSRGIGSNPRNSAIDSQQSRSRHDSMDKGKNVLKNSTIGSGSDSRDPTSDPSTANARVYVGNIQGNSISEYDLRSYFSSFGVVIGVRMHPNKSGKKSYAFVQYSDEEGAQNCLLVGKHIVIGNQQLDLGPVKSDQSSRELDPWDNQRSLSGNHFGGGGGMARMDSPSFSNAGVGMGMNQTPMIGGNVRVRPGNDPLDPNRPNDVEIVVASVAQRNYAEYIESQLKSMNIKVDLIFPPPGLSTSKIITDLIKRHCLYAIMITEENEMHRSISLHILHGQLQAHCNIPVSNALQMIEQNFIQHVRTTRQSMMGSQMMQQNLAPGMFGGGGNAFGQNSFGNSNNGLLGPVPSDGPSNNSGSGLLGAVPGMAAGGDVSNMYSLVLDSLQMAKELKNVKGERDIQELMTGREFQERVAALKAKADSVKYQLPQAHQHFFQ